MYVVRALHFGQYRVVSLSVRRKVGTVRSGTSSPLLAGRGAKSQKSPTRLGQTSHKSLSRLSPSGCVRFAITPGGKHFRRISTNGFRNALDTLPRRGAPPEAAGSPDFLKDGSHNSHPRFAAPLSFVQPFGLTAANLSSFLKQLLHASNPSDILSTSDKVCHPS